MFFQIKNRTESEFLKNNNFSILKVNCPARYISKDSGGSTLDKQIIRGEIYFANLNPAMGSEQGGDRPVLILQNNMGNSFSSTVIVAAITGRHDKKPLQPSHVYLPTNFGLNRDSMVMLEQLRTIDKSRLRRYIGKLDENTMKGIDLALLISMGLENHE